MSSYESLRQKVTKASENRWAYISDVSTEDLLGVLAELDELRNQVKPRTTGRRTDYSADFCAAWDIYPRKQDVNKQKAYKAWQARIREKIKPEAMIEGVRRYAAHCKAYGKEQRHILLPATFFGPDEHYAVEYSMPDKQALMQRVMAEQWHRTSDGITAKAREVGVQPRPGESWDSLKKRIIDKLSGE